MNYAIIAAGEGSRLLSEGVLTPKPLVKIEGMPMIERLMRIFAQNDAESISVIVNESMTEVAEFLRNWANPVTLQSLGIGSFNLVVKSTPSSMHSFYELSKELCVDQICLTTVDTIFKPEEFSLFINKIDKSSDGLFAVTRYIDDESPLFIDTDVKKIIGFHDCGSYDFVSGGIYVLNTKKAFPILQQCVENRMSRMRNFQRTLLTEGLTIKYSVFNKILDVDHAEDIFKAEQFLKDKPNKMLLIYRDYRFSPRNVKKDFAILNKVSQNILKRRENIELTEISEKDLRWFSSLNDYFAVVGMYRKQSSIKKIVKLSEGENLITLNDIEGIRKLNCSRLELFQVLKSHGIKTPLLKKVSQKQLPVWIKISRKDSVKKSDVVFCKSLQEVHEVRDQIGEKLFKKALFMKHLLGDLIKVYVVLDNSKIRFLRWFYPQEKDYTKFGQEVHNNALR